MNSAALPIMECIETNIEPDNTQGWWYAWTGPRERPTFSRRSRSFDWAFSVVYVEAHGGNADGLDEARAMARQQWFTRPDAARIWDECREDLEGVMDGLSIHNGEGR